MDGLEGPGGSSPGIVSDGLDVGALVDVDVDDEDVSDLGSFFRVDLVGASSPKGFFLKMSPKVTLLGIGREDALGPRSTVRKPS